MSTQKRLTEVLESAIEIPFDDSSKFILFSDCHRGDNSTADDFAHNQQIFFFALERYYEDEFTYIELGDGDELWENRDFSEIRKSHDHVYWLMSEFYHKDRFYWIWGNHNREWEDVRKVKQYLYSYLDRNGKPRDLFPDIKVHEGLVLRYKPTNGRILLVHGHQGQLLNDRLWWVGRHFVRNAWRPLQILGAKDPTSPAKNFRVQQKVERELREWARSNCIVLIAGHTHRPVFPEVGDGAPPYFNVGSCVHPRCITGIKIEEGTISLIKWWPKPNEQGVLQLKEEYVREETKEVELKTIFERVEVRPVGGHR